MAKIFIAIFGPDERLPSSATLDADNDDVNDDDDDDGEQDDHEGACSGRRGGGVGPVPSQRDDNHQEPLRHGEAQVQLVLVIVVIITFITIITLTFRLVVLRNKESLEQLSVKPISQYPLLLDDMVGHIIVFILNDIIIILFFSITWSDTSLFLSSMISSLSSLHR